MHDRHAPLLLSSLGTFLLTVTAHATTLTQVTDFGSNPGNDSLYYYKPAAAAVPAPIVVAMHYCGGSASAYSGMVSGMVSGADRYGYILIFPQTTKYNSCWDVFSTDSLTHAKGGDSASIVSMVNYVVTNFGGDRERVYALGTSSGAMMTNILLGAYPDVFKAGSAFSGVAFGCWIGADPSSGWNSSCSGGNVIKSGQAWGDLVRAAYPGYAGYRGRIQLWHGSADEILNYANFGEEIKEWTNVFGVSETPSTTETDTPSSGSTRTRYNDACGATRVEAVSEAGQSHQLDVATSEVIRFFALDKPGVDPGPAACNGAAGAAGAGKAAAGNAGAPVAGTANGGGSGASGNTSAAGAGVAGSPNAQAGQGAGGTAAMSAAAGATAVPGSGGLTDGGGIVDTPVAGNPSTKPKHIKPDIDDCLCSFAGQRTNRNGSVALVLATLLASVLRRRRER